MQSNDFHYDAPVCAGRLIRLVQDISEADACFSGTLGSGILGKWILTHAGTTCIVPIRVCRNQVVDDGSE